MNYSDIDILLVDDSEDDTFFTMRAFQKRGVTGHIHHVRDGVEALDFVYCRGAYHLRNFEKKLKLIVLDLKMPKLSGFEVLDKIKTDPELKHTPVVILSSSREDSDIQKCYLLGANSFVVKPVDSDLYFSAVEQIGVYWTSLNQSLN